MRQDEHNHERNKCEEKRLVISAIPVYGYFRKGFLFVCTIVSVNILGNVSQLCFLV